MGRFYKTDKPQMLDYMYKLPEQYMLAAVQQASEDITQNQAAMFDLYGKLQLNALDPDKPRAREILDRYEQHINRLSKELQEDPLSYRKRTGDIMGLARDFQKEFTRGEAAAIQGNYDAYQKWVTDWEKIGREKQLENSDWLNSLGALNLKRYKEQGGVKYDKATGKYNQIQMEELVKYQDIDEQLATIAKEYEPEIKAWADANLSDDGNFIIEVGNKKERKNMKPLLNAMTDQILANENIGKYILQGSQVGALSGYYNEEGKFIRPWVEVDGKIQFQGTLGQKLRAAVEKFAYDNTTQAYERWKNVSKDGGSSKITGLGHMVSIKTGEISNAVSPFYDGNGNAQGQVNNEIENLTSEPKKKEYLHNVLGDDVNGVVSAMIGDNVPAATAERITNDLWAAIDEMAKETPDWDMINKTLADNPRIVDIGPYKNAYIEMHANKMDAGLVSEQNRYMKLISDRTGTPIDDLYDQFKSIKTDVVSSQGAWYDKNPQHQISFHRALKAIADKYTNYAQLPDSFVAYTYENGVPKAEMVTKDDFLKTYEFVKEEGQSNEAGLNQSIANARGGILAALEDGTTDKSKSDMESFYMIEGALPYSNGEGQKPGTYKQPFQLIVKDKKGTSVSIILPRTLAPADIISQLDGEYNKKYQLDRRMERIASGINPLIDSGNLTDKDVEAGIPVWVDTNEKGKEYGMYYVPNTSDSKYAGQIRVTPEDGDSYPLEYNKQLILQYYEDLYGTTPLD